MPAEPASGGAFVMLLLAFVLAGVILITLQSRRTKPTSAYAGRPLPPLQQVEGWINVGDPLTNQDLQGKLVLIDFWATWCRPCVRGIPELMKFNNQYRDQGVVVVGLTAEGGDAANQVQSFVEARDGMIWPVGYGAQLPFDMMGIEGIPTYMLFDRTGTSVWGGHSLYGIEDALLPLLAEKR